MRAMCSCPGEGMLKPVDLAAGLTGHQCEACEGAVLDMNAYRQWQAHVDPKVIALPHEVVHGLIAVEDWHGVRSCPQCNRLMQRLRVSTELPDFRVDRCTGCQLVWLDRGEWSALAAHGLAWRLDEVLSDGWQRQLQRGEVRGLREDALRDRHGDECVDELGRIREWLRRQDRPDELLALLRTGW